MVDVCQESGVKLKRFLFVSSIAAVGETGKSGYADETITPNPRSDYGKSKLAAENYIKEVGDKLPSTIVRLPLVYGPRNFHDIYTIFRFAGKRIKLVLGSTSTSVGFVKDITSGIILAAEKDCAIGQTYFLGEEEAYSYPELAGHVARGVGKKTVKVRIPYFILYIIAFFVETVSAIKGTEPFLQRRPLKEFLKSNWRFSMKKAMEELNFKTEYPLPRGAKITADWYRENGFI
jgi:nucleoside-diphosphate-sugar epimerase